MNTVKIHRKISSPQLRIAELKDFIGKDVEITISEKNTENNGRKNAAGMLSQFSNSSKRPNEKNAWGVAVKEKYGNS